VIDSVSDDNGPSDTDGITNDSTLQIHGEADKESTVRVYQGGNPIGTAIPDDQGFWGLDYSSTLLPDGTYSFTAAAMDGDGNLSPFSAPFTVTIDTVAPAAPVIATVTTASGASVSDGITNDPKLILAGSAEPGTVVQLFQDDAPIGTATADAGGAWTYDHTATTLADGTCVFTALATDLAGNNSSLSAAFPIVIDTTTPSQPWITGISRDTGISSADGITNDPTLVVLDSAVPGASVQLLCDGQLVGTVLADASGSWSVDLTTTPLADGSYTFTASSTELDGNTSTSRPRTVRIDTTEVSPSLRLDPRSDTGVVGDALTLVATPTFVDASEPGSSVAVYDGPILLGQTFAQASGQWSFTSPHLDNGLHAITASSTDRAGNLSPLCQTLEVTTAGDYASVTERFVAQLYLDLLRRAPDAAGLQFFAGLLNRGAPPEQITAAFTSTAEYERQVVASLYAQLLHRSAAVGDLDAWSALLTSGSTAEEIAAALAGSAEYYQQRGGGTADGFLDALYSDALHRSVDAAVRAQLDSLLSAGTPVARIASAVFGSAEYQHDLVEDWSGTYLGQTGELSTAANYTAQLSAGARDEAVLASMLASDDYFVRLFGQTRNQFYVAQLVQDLLPQQSDPAALASFTELLDQGMSRDALAQSLIASPDYRSRQVDDFYHRFLGRSADAAALEVGIQFLSQGGTREQLAAGVLASKEYFSKHGSTKDGFLAALYQDVLNRSLDPGAAQTLAGILTGSSASRQAVALAALTSEEARRVMVVAWYHQYLRRPPSDGELDQFVGAFQSGMADDQAQTVLLSSPEYLGRLT
jgi:hypothetical protein